jgi:hypothetical protein
MLTRCKDTRTPARALKHSLVCPLACALTLLLGPLTSIACPRPTHLLTHHPRAHTTPHSSAHPPPTRTHNPPSVSLSRLSMKTRWQTRIGPCHSTQGQQRRCFVERSPSVVWECGCVVPPLTPPLLSHTRKHTHTSTHIHHLAHPHMCYVHTRIPATHPYTSHPPIYHPPLALTHNGTHRCSTPPTHSPSPRLLQSQTTR